MEMLVDIQSSGIIDSRRCRVIFKPAQSFLGQIVRDTISKVEDLNIFEHILASFLGLATIA